MNSGQEVRAQTSPHGRRYPLVRLDGKPSNTYTKGHLKPLRGAAGGLSHRAALTPSRRSSGTAAQ
jgi:hypothetical protein